MSMQNHIKAICKAAFYHLRKISHIRKYLSSQTAEMLVHENAFKIAFANILVFQTMVLVLKCLVL